MYGRIQGAENKRDALPEGVNPRCIIEQSIIFPTDAKHKLADGAPDVSRAGYGTKRKNDSKSGVIAAVSTRELGRCL